MPRSPLPPAEPAPEPAEPPETLANLARRTFGWSRLHPAQGRCAAALVAGRDVLAVLPTGAGKSAIFQLAALRRPAPTLVVSPLIALQRDQVAGLREAGQAALSLHAGLPAADRKVALDALRERRLGFLYLAPEQLGRDDLQDALAAAPPASSPSTRPTVCPLGATTSARTACGWVIWSRNWDVPRWPPSPPPPPCRYGRRSSNGSVCATRWWWSRVLTGRTCSCPWSGTPLGRPGSEPSPSWPRRPTTPVCGRRSVSGCSRSSTPAGSTWWWPPLPSGRWASTRRTCVSCCTPSCPTRRTPTTRRSAGPAATGQRRRRCCSIGPKTPGCAGSRPPRRRPRSSWPRFWPCCRRRPRRAQSARWLSGPVCRGAGSPGWSRYSKGPGQR